MTQLEDQLRTAFRAKASDISPPLPPLDLQSRPVLGLAARRGSGVTILPVARQWLGPVAAAVAVLAVVAGALVVGRNVPADRTPPTALIQNAIPPYYVAITTNAPMSTPFQATTTTVRQTSTGAVLATIRPPRPYIGFQAVTGAADDRTFVLLATGHMSLATATAPERFYLLRINPSASPASRTQLTPLTAADISGGKQLQAMALSPDGQALGAVINHGIGDYLYIYYLRTGKSRVWIRKLCDSCRQTELGPSSPWPYGPVTLSWSSNGKRLAFVSSAGDNQLRLLNISKPGNNAELNSSIVPVRGVPVNAWRVVEMTPDGKSVLISYAESRGLFVQMGLGRLSVTSGTFRQINRLPFANNSHGTGYASVLQNADNVLWTNYDASKIIVENARPGQTAGIYTASHYTPLNWPANVLDAAW